MSPKKPGNYADALDDRGKVRPDREDYEEVASHFDSSDTSDKNLAEQTPSSRTA